MRLAALSDIHGNLPALEAVLVVVEQADVDAIAVCESQWLEFELDEVRPRRAQYTTLMTPVWPTF